MTELQRAKKISIIAAREAGKLLMKNLTKVKQMSLKAKHDIVTEIDLKAEKIIIDKIKRAFPDHNILSEESIASNKDSEYSWVVDPIDGTINFYHATAPFRVAICLTKNGSPLLSTIYNPIKNELYYAEKGKGATINNKPIRVNKNKKAENSVVMTHISSKEDARERTISALNSIFNKTLHMRAFGSGIAAMTYVASGKFDVFFNVRTYPWDILAGALLIEEAGGIVTDIEGKKITLKSNSVLATNGKVHKQILELLKNI
ncbi:MAG: inositol monophosphatase [Patescibacteria group bacterium]|nr:inositol monophosphatase [Patescibacteria group bacterium]MDD4611255.1 inositol monophosphatase [Patescibacteria group bacterium]